MAAQDQQFEPGNVDEKDHGWAPDSGTDTTMKEHSHKEREARDTQAASTSEGAKGGEGPGGETPPPETGQSTSRRGEDVGRQEGRDFETEGTSGADRPYGHIKEQPGAAPSKPIDPSMPDTQVGDQGG